VWTHEAALDLADIVTYIADESPTNAKRLLDRIRNRAKNLESNPRRGRIVPEFSRFSIHTFRELLIKPYRIVYRIAEDRVYVLAVLDARRDLQDVLLERLLRKRPD
jgi:addiction module RelE/StbE family toxin